MQSTNQAALIELNKINSLLPLHLITRLFYNFTGTFCQLAQALQYTNYRMISRHYVPCNSNDTALDVNNL